MYMRCFKATGWLSSSPTLRRYGWVYAALLLELLIIVGCMVHGGIRTVESVPDSPTYLNYVWSFPEIFAQWRTPGYPLLLRWVHCFNPSYTWLPTIHLFAHALAVLFFVGCLTLSRVSPATVFGVSFPLLFAPAIRSSYSMILTDSLACSMSIAVVGLIFLVARKPSDTPAWIVLSLLAFATVLVRQGYLFLLLLMAVAVPLLLLLRIGVVRGRRILKRVVFRTLLAAFLPFFIYCGARWLTVGHFGLVSFGGNFLVGIVSQFIMPEDIPKLSPEFRPISVHILQAQRQRKLISVNENGARVLSFMELMNNDGIYIYELIMPYLQEHGLQSQPEINR
jgi:hypothetical protein